MMRAPLRAGQRPTRQGPDLGDAPGPTGTSHPHSCCSRSGYLLAQLPHGWGIRAALGAATTLGDTWTVPWSQVATTPPFGHQPNIIEAVSTAHDQPSVLPRPHCARRPSLSSTLQLRGQCAARASRARRGRVTRTCYVERALSARRVPAGAGGHPGGNRHWPRRALSAAHWEWEEPLRADTGSRRMGTRLESARRLRER